MRKINKVNLFLFPWLTNVSKNLLMLVVFCFSFFQAAFAQERESRIIEDGGTGQYKAIMESDPSLLTHTLFRPQDLNKFSNKEKLPIIVWGNGACFNSPWEHVNFLSEVASHGFFVVAIGHMPKEGEKERGKSYSSQMIDAIEWVIAVNKDSKSPFFEKLDISNIALSGMSCGGLQTLESAADPRIKTIVVCNSGILSRQGEGMPGMPQINKTQLSNIHTPTLYLLGGESDIAYNNGMDDFSKINHVPVFVGNLNVGHAGTYAKPHGGEFARVATAWYSWQLKGDTHAGKMFTGNPCELSLAEGWTVQKKNIN